MPKLPDFVTAFMDHFTSHNTPIYLVGGTVRGLLMNHAVNDWDFTTPAQPSEIMSLFPHSFYNNSFGTVGIPIKTNDNEYIFQVTTHRKESGYMNARHPDQVTWAKTLEEDLARRDFTINAIAYDGSQIFDPFKGQEDIKRKVIRAVGDPDIRFQEDALRLLRAVRQATQLGFSIEEKTLKSLTTHAKLIEKISWERIRDEFFKLLEAPHAADGILMLKGVGLLSYILPEVEVCFGIDQVSPQRHHIYDVGTHLVESLRSCQHEDIITRFATLIHDIGKKETYQKDEKSGLITFYNHEVAGEHLAEGIADRFHLSKKEKTKLVLLVRHHQFTVSEDQSDKAVRRFVRQVGVENIDSMLALRTADRLGSGAKETSWRTELFKKRIEEVQYIPFAVKDLTVSGEDVMSVLGIRPGPQVGTILQTLFERVENQELPNTREALLDAIQQSKK